MRLIDADGLLLNAEQYRCGRNEYSRMVDVWHIEHAPTIEAEPVRHGRWELHDDGSGTCDQCHFKQKNVWDDDGYQNFCSVCGAKMDLGE